MTINNSTAPKREAKHPYLSGLTAIFGFAAIGVFQLPVEISELASSAAEIVAATAVKTSPLLCTATTAIAAVSMAKPRSLLSKAFSLSALGTGGISLYTFADVLLNQPTSSTLLMGSVITALGMTATGTLNTAAHYTRNIGPGAPKPQNPSA